jgi:hypothetical protein
MDIDASATASREPVASRDTALACFVQLAVQNGLDPTTAAAIQPPDVRDSDSLPISGVIELARELGYLAEHARTDWQSLQSIGFANPILVLLRNTNVVILTGGSREGAEEVAVWDPLHRDSEVLYVPRQEFERAWSGDLLRLTLTLPSSGTPTPSPHSPAAAAEQAPDPGEHQPSGSRHRLSSAVRLCLLAVVILAPVSVGLFLFRTPAEHSFPATAPVGGASERTNAAAVLEARTAERSSDQQVASAAATSAAPKPNVQPSEPAAAAPAVSDGHEAGEANRTAAAPRELTGAGQGRALESPPAGPAPVIPPASGETNPETDPNASTAAPIIPPADATLTAAEISTLLTLGDKSFSSGDVASARLYYGRAANAGDGEAALRLGETFDPVFLEHAHLHGARGDLTTALTWYRRARDMGIGEAEFLLKSLEAK